MMDKYDIVGMNQYALNSLGMSPKDAVLIRAFHELAETAPTDDGEILAIAGPGGVIWYDIPYQSLIDLMPIFEGQHPNTIRMNLNRLADKGILETARFKRHHARNKLFRIPKDVKAMLNLE
jgi:hypothetical protein